MPLLCAAGSLLLVWWLVRFGAYGIDFTDESFYFVWIADPHKYSWPASQFGFIYHPFYSLVNGDIASLRLINILTTFSLAWVLCYICISNLAPGPKEGKITRLTISAGLATSAFVLFDSSVSTPNYNSLNFQALLITAIGLVLADKTAQRSSMIGWVLIGVGGWLAFMAKPTTAVALVFVVFFYLLISSKFLIRMLSLTVVCVLALLLLSAIWFDGSIVGFVRRLQVGIDFSLLQDGGYELSKILRIDDFNLDKRIKFFFLLISFALLIALFSLWRDGLLVGLLISVAFFSITALLALGQVHQSAGFNQFQGLLMFAVTGAIVIITLVFGRIRALKTVSRQEWAITALFMIFPHTYAFGTNGNYWVQGGGCIDFLGACRTNVVGSLNS